MNTFHIIILQVIDAGVAMHYLYITLKFEHIKIACGNSYLNKQGCSLDFPKKGGGGGGVGHTLPHTGNLHSPQQMLGSENGEYVTTLH